MRILRRPFAVFCTVALAGCHGMSPNPSPTGPTPTTLTPNQLAITIGPPELPAPGGTATIDVAVSQGGYTPVGGVQVALSATKGTVVPSTLVSDTTGHAKAEWRGSESAMIVAVAGDLRSEAAVSVIAPAAPPPPPTRTPPNNQDPDSLPDQNPNQNPDQGPNQPQTRLPGPAGDLVLTIAASPSAPTAATPVTLSTVLTSTTGASVPRVDKYAWDVNGDLANDHVGWFPAPVVTYAPGTYTVYATVLTTDNREVSTSRTLVVAVAPTVRATLTASSSTPDLSTPVTFTAGTETAGDTGAIVSYAWDFDGNGSTDQTTAGNTATTTYAKVGPKTARVVVRSANGQTGSAQASLTVSDAPLAVAISGGPGTMGVPIAVTATVITAGTVPVSVTYAIDYQNDGTVDEEVTGGTTKTIAVTYNAAGAKTIKITATASDGRTATSTLTMAVS